MTAEIYDTEHIISYSHVTEAQPAMTVAINKGVDLEAKELVFPLLFAISARSDFQGFVFPRRSCLPPSPRKSTAILSMHPRSSEK